MSSWDSTHRTSTSAPTSSRARFRGCAWFRTRPAPRLPVRYLLRRRSRGNVRADSRCRLTRDMMLLATDPVPLHQYESAPPHETLSERKRRFEQSVLPHFDAAYNLARWLTRNDQDAQDVAQEA